MKVAITMISALAVGLMVAVNNYTPLMELRSIVQHRRRAIFSILLGAAGFIFIMAAILLGSIDMALQYEVQGFVLWNTILAVAAGFFGLSILSFLMAKVVFPKPSEAKGILGVRDFAGIAASLEAYRHLFEAQPETEMQKGHPAAAAAAEAEQARDEIKDRPHGDFTIEQQPGFVH